MMKESKIKNALRIILYPILGIRRIVLNKRQLYLGKYKPRQLASELYKKCMGKELDWKQPRDLNAKINWLKFYGDTSLWGLCADKYRVREYVKQKGLEDILVKLYGHWDDVEEIDWGSLPQQFVMKVNNGSGDVLICTDKRNLDIKKVSRKYKDLLRLKFWYKFAEPHYGAIKPCVIAEELLDVNKQSLVSNSLIDYKVWCFGGEPHYILICYDRSSHSLVLDLYDINWNQCPEKMNYAGKFKKPKQLMPRPKSLEKMLMCASVLSEGFPQARIDFYEVDGKVYFGEITLTSQSGYMDYFTEEFLNELGDLTVIPELEK